MNSAGLASSNGLWQILPSISQTLTFPSGGIGEKPKQEATIFTESNCQRKRYKGSTLEEVNLDLKI